MDQHQLLEWINPIQGRWSRTAGTLKSAHDNVRWATFAMSILAALLTAVASQIDNDETTRRALAITAAVLLAVCGVLSARFLGADKSARWLRARAASEALKCAAYQCATQAAPFDDPNSRNRLLREEVTRIENDVDDLQGIAAADQPGSTPKQPLTPQAYLDERVKKAIQWYEKSGAVHHVMSHRLKAIELVLVLITAALSAFVGAVSQEWLKAHAGGLDWAAMVAVLTTLSAAVLAHIEAGRYDFLVTSYRAAGRRLGQELLAVPAAIAPSAEWSRFVSQCEAVIAAENSGWAAKFAKP